jgi:hypothetical protein
VFLVVAQMEHSSLAGRSCFFDVVAAFPAFLVPALGLVTPPDFTRTTALRLDRGADSTSSATGKGSGSRVASRRIGLPRVPDRPVGGAA